jgi:hypothetical protein
MGTEMKERKNKMEFNINDRVIEVATGESGVIIDKMFSQAKDCFIYIVKPDDSNCRTHMRREEELEPFSKPKEYKIDTQVADGVVIVVLYEIENGQEYEVCRGHGHIIHEGAEGIAQALSYASKRAFSDIDTGIYFKQRREN